jgi:hypothetical protein
MKSLLGPILYIGDCEKEVWRFRVHLLLEGTGNAPEDVEVTCPAAQSVGDPQEAFVFPEWGDGGATYWSWPVEVQRAGSDQWVAYEVKTESGEKVEGVHGWRFPNVCVPRQGALPNIAFFSCNGRSHEGNYRLGESERLWRHMDKTHEHHQGEAERGFNMLVGGGDQIYADELWRKEPLKSVERAMQEPEEEYDFPEDFKEQVREKYVQLYIEHWKRPHMRRVFARIPGVFTWDDHDIMDGWGSTYESEHTEAMGRTYEAARDAFVAFQLGGKQIPCVQRSNEAEDSHFFQTLSFAEDEAHLDVLVLDIRSERTRQRVMSESQWSALDDALQKRAAETEDVRRHLLVVSSIPLVHRRYHYSTALSDIAAATSTLEDDMIDQWEHGNHRGERDRLIDRLLSHAQDSGSRVTILSGDVHVGARGRVVSTAPDHRPPQSAQGKAIIHQITASGIGHPAPDWKQWAGILAASTDDPDPINDEVTAEMIDVSPERSYLRARNWLSMRFDDPLPADANPGRRKKGFRLRCKWLMEDEGAFGEWIEEDPDEREKARRNRWDQDIPGMRAISRKAVIPAYAQGDLVEP